MTGEARRGTLLTMIPLFKAMWRAQHAFLHGLIQTQNRILMAVTYLIAIAPVALVFKLMGKRLLPEVCRSKGRVTPNGIDVAEQFREGGDGDGRSFDDDESRRGGRTEGKHRDDDGGQQPDEERAHRGRLHAAGRRLDSGIRASPPAPASGRATAGHRTP